TGTETVAGGEFVPGGGDRVAERVDDGRGHGLGRSDAVGSGDHRGPTLVAGPRSGNAGARSATSCGKGSLASAGRSVHSVFNFVDLMRRRPCPIVIHPDPF